MKQPGQVEDNNFAGLARRQFVNMWRHVIADKGVYSRLTWPQRRKRGDLWECNYLANTLHHCECTRPFLKPQELSSYNDDVMKCKHFARYSPFVRGIHRSPVNSPHKGQWRGALMFSLICACINGWETNHEDGDLRRPRAHYYIIVMFT